MLSNFKTHYILIAFWMPFSGIPILHPNQHSAQCRGPPAFPTGCCQLHSSARGRIRRTANIKDLPVRWVCPFNAWDATPNHFLWSAYIAERDGNVSSSLFTWAFFFHISSESTKWEYVVCVCMSESKIVSSNTEWHPNELERGTIRNSFINKENNIKNRQKCFGVWSHNCLPLKLREMLQCYFSTVKCLISLLTSVE